MHKMSVTINLVFVNLIFLFLYFIVVDPLNVSNPQFESAFIAPGAIALGDVTIGEDCSIWYHATIRGDSSPIRIGRSTNIQDNCVLHGNASYPVVIGEMVTVGHGAIIHGCTIEAVISAKTVSSVLVP